MRIFKSASCTIFVVLLSIISAYSAADALKESLFNEVNAAVASANAANANLLAPTTYAKAKRLFDRANSRFKKGQSIEKIRQELRQASALFAKAEEASKIAGLTFELAIKARNDAKLAKANKQAKKQWDSAESIFVEGTKALEMGRLKRAKDRAKKAEARFRQAELIAIKASYLSETKTLIAQAKKQRVDRYAPRTLYSAQTLLASAEKELNENRYDTDYPRSLAKQARYEAKHAIYLASRVKLLIDEEMTAEEILLKAEVPLTKIASELDIAAEFDTGFDNTSSEVLSRIKALLKDSYELGERKKEIALLEQEIAGLEKRLGIQSKRLSQQEAQRKKLRDVTNLFSRNEATVLTQGNNVLIRLIGLTFNPGSSTIATRNFQLLNRVQKAIKRYSNYRVVIEGHTDSFGSDETNLALSMDRAKSVKSYLLANMPGRSSGEIEAIGYGETRPIANNETPEGRSKNRRIDLVLVPE